MNRSAFVDSLNSFCSNETSWKEFNGGNKSETQQYNRAKRECRLEIERSLGIKAAAKGMSNS